MPLHIRCATHTLNLLATTDYNNIVKNSISFKTRHTSAMKKCNILWKWAGQPNSVEVFEKYLGHSISYPVPTRWNSYFDSISEILSIKQDVFNTIQSDLNINIPDKLTDSDMAYLKEYCTVLKPIAETIDFLQGQENTFFGYLVPSIVSLKNKMETANKLYRTKKYT